MRKGPGAHASWHEYCRMTSWSDKIVYGQPAACAGDPVGATPSMKDRSNERMPWDGSARIGGTIRTEIACENGPMVGVGMVYICLPSANCPWTVTNKPVLASPSPCNSPTMGQASTKTLVLSPSSCFVVGRVDIKFTIASDPVWRDDVDLSRLLTRCKLREPPSQGVHSSFR